LESTIRERVGELEFETPRGDVEDRVDIPEWREVYRRLSGNWFVKAEASLLTESHDWDALADSSALRGELQAGIRMGDFYWLAEWKGRYAAKDGWEETLLKQNQWGLRVKSDVIPGLPDGLDFDIQPAFYLGYVEGWPIALDRWSAEVEVEFVTRVTDWFYLAAAPKLEFAYYPQFGTTSREDTIESLRLMTTVRLAQGWSLSLEGQVSRTESTALSGDNSALSVTPLLRNVVRF
jgi:hypothetical protein